MHQLTHYDILDLLDALLLFVILLHELMQLQPLSFYLQLALRIFQYQLLVFCLVMDSYIP